jgi:diguanylate cyclase (GGDEF)-like protein
LLVNARIEPRPGATKRAISTSAAVMYGGAGLLSLIEALTPGGPYIDPLPGVAALAFALALALVGARLPHQALAALGPIGAAMIAFSLSTSGGAGDGAVLYMWPVLWEAYFFGRRGAILIVVSVGVAQGISLQTIPDGDLDRWLDVFVSATLVATVVEVLAMRNRALLARLAEEAQVDQLTGLLNRRGFEERAEIEVARADREQGSMGVVSFDLDRFKRVNDENGHAAGDRALVRIGKTFRAEMRDTDVLARVGGEEFVALLPGGGVTETRAFAERVRIAFEESSDPSMPAVTVSAGVSVAIAPVGLDGVLKQADLAMYEAKAAGRNRTVVQT